jgi:hypothetical protein
MSKKHSGVPSKTQPQIDRRLRVIDMLNAQLKRGTKTIKDGSQQKLSDKDIKRIKQELEVLKNRV